MRWRRLCSRLAIPRVHSQPPSKVGKLSRISLHKVGDVQQTQGDLSGALKSYVESLAIDDQLSKSDPSNARWQRDLSVSYDNVGNVQMAGGDLASALKSYRKSLEVRDGLAK